MNRQKRFREFFSFFFAKIFAKKTCVREVVDYANSVSVIIMDYMDTDTRVGAKIECVHPKK